MSDHSSTSRRQRPLFKALCVSGFFLLAGLLLAAFRPAGYSAEGVIDESEGQFQVESQVELYSAVIMGLDGQPRHRELIMAYLYEEDGTRGLWHWEDPKDPEGTAATLLILQDAGEDVVLLYRAPGSTRAVPVFNRQLTGTIGDSLWNFEDALDDDKEERGLSNAGERIIQGEQVLVVEARWGDRTLRRLSAYGHRQAYVNSESDRFLGGAYYARNGDLIKSMRAYSYADRSVDGVTPKFRAQRLNIQSYATDETMLLISMQWNYQAELSRDWFSREALNLSAAERRSRMEAFLTEHSEATSEEN